MDEPITDYSITPSDDGTYITLEIIGEMNREISMAYTLEAHALGAELGIRCYLVDVTRAPNVESPLVNYRIATRDIRPEPEIDQGACVAVLVDPADDSHDLWEVVARSAGIDVTLFHDRDAAVAHLARAAQRLHRPPGEANSSG